MSLPSSLHEIPFLRLLVPLCSGILIGYYLNVFPSVHVWGKATITLFTLVAISYFVSAKWHLRWVFGLTISIFLMAVGIALTERPPLVNDLKPLQDYPSIARLLEPPQARLKSWRTLAELSHYRDNGVWQPAQERVMLYFDASDTAVAKLKYGDILAATICPRPIDPPGNPYQFDLKKYFEVRGVRFTSFVKKGGVIKVGENRNPIVSASYRLRDRLIGLYRESGLEGQKLAVASALTLGYKDLLDDELRRVYAATGAMHILAVSGLHVGILYVMLSFALSFLNRKFALRIVKMLTILAFLWFFAFLTGMSASVTRSVIMFSLLVVGESFHRKQTIYNTLSATAFVMLLADPMNLFNLGFQLSFLAVLSIVFFYPYIYNLIYVKCRMLNYAWSLIAVSVAAQIGTFIIGILNFHQFPNYFILTNLLAIPLSTVVLYLSVVLVLVSPISAFALPFGKLLAFAISFLNRSLELVDAIPGSLTEGLYISNFQALILSLAVVLTAAHIATARKLYLFGALSLVPLFLGVRLYHSIERMKPEVVIYSIPGQTLLSIKEGRDLRFIDLDTSRSSPAERYGFFVQGYLSEMAIGRQYEVWHPYSRCSNPNGSVTCASTGKGITIVNCPLGTLAIPCNHSLEAYSGQKKYVVDVLVANGQCPMNILDLIKPGKIVVDLSLPRKRLESILVQAKMDNIPVHVISSQGAYIWREY